MEKEIFQGIQPVQMNHGRPKGSFEKLNGDLYYKIADFNAMDPFLMSIVSSSDHWMFISSLGGLTAGRKNAENALFPYTTDDKIHDNYRNTGSITVIMVEKEDRKYLWEPFSKNAFALYKVSRNIYKSIWGNAIVFEEINDTLGITFWYSWSFSDAFGFVRKVQLENHNDFDLDMQLLDGFQHILPPGLPFKMQNERSNLVNAYKKSELDSASGLAIYSLSSLIIDRAEPGESLLASTCWQHGLNPKALLLSSKQLHDFRQGVFPTTEFDCRAERGAFLIADNLTVLANQKKSWLQVAEINQNLADIFKLKAQLLADKTILIKELETSLNNDTYHLKTLVATADGLQSGGEQEVSVRHFANTLFNIMRGGLPADGYIIKRADFSDFVKSWNIKVFHKNKPLLDSLSSQFSLHTLFDIVNKQQNPDLIRLACEYLPFRFSRRHGDPSRPWNKFSIEIKDDAGNPKKYYEGNWRDIFQNWEALALSFPDFLKNMIAKFLNASTIDGYNPYRIDSNGVDWEITEPDDPWSFIGYWGDHQVIYLLKLLESFHAHAPNELNELLLEPLFVFANVPYRIKKYSDILKNPYDTIIFDQEIQEITEKKSREIGNDGKLVLTDADSPFYVTLMDKLLIQLLTKLSNFVPEGGIWLNTQRPEWNDANNALVGNGLSMVTLYYMHRFNGFFIQLIRQSTADTFFLNNNVFEFFEEIFQVFNEFEALLLNGFSDSERRDFMHKVGKAGENYRNKVYSVSIDSTTSPLPKEKLIEFLDITQSFLAQSIGVNRRSDKLFHAYNLLSFSAEGRVNIEHLYLMLEGQVAVLSADFLSVEEVIELVNALPSSNLFRKDQNSYLLYPDKVLPRFIEKNKVPAARAKESKWLTALLNEENNDILIPVNNELFCFHPDLYNERELLKRLHLVNEKIPALSFEEEVTFISNLYEETFKHHYFTGRSGTFFGYEGLGSIYWHMVSKLVLAVQENVFKAMDAGAPDAKLKELIQAYYHFRSGLGFNKTPAEYGAFPSDPYSHTPANKGAQQPGMTGQVKEDFLSRFGELGLRVINGQIHIQPILLSLAAFHQSKQLFNFIDCQGKEQSLTIPPKSLVFTYCQTPFIFQIAEENHLNIHSKEGIVESNPSLFINDYWSKEIFSRSGTVSFVEVFLKESKLFS